ncbi:hypothetical protein ACP70R_046038 [Stipagrostis hirtigluma subsp. patula]
MALRQFRGLAVVRAGRGSELQGRWGEEEEGCKGGEEDRELLTGDSVGKAASWGMSRDSRTAGEFGRAGGGREGGGRGEHTHVTKSRFLLGGWRQEDGHGRAGVELCGHELAATPSPRPPP